VIGAPELKSDPRFQERDERKKNRKALTPLVEEKLKQKPTAHWVEALNARDVPSGEILPLKAALAQPQVAHRKVLHSVKVDDEIGEVKLFGLTAQLSKTPGEITSPRRASAPTRKRCWSGWDTRRRRGGSEGERGRLNETDPGVGQQMGEILNLAVAP